jgi:hypothetical protein
MYESAKATARGEVEFIAVFDHDDETREQYPEGPTYLVAEPGTLQSALWNVAWAAGSGDIAHLGADDLIFRTPGWDTKVAHAFRLWRDRIGMVYVNDLHPVRWNHGPFFAQKASDAIGMPPGFVFSANPFCSREWIDAAGFFTPPYYASWEADTWIYQLAEGISRGRYIGDVVVEHMHPMANKAPMDATYRRGAWGNRKLRREGFQRTNSPEMKEIRAEQIRKLTEAIQTARGRVPVQEPA